MLGYISQFLKKTYVMTEVEVRKLIHDPTELITRAIQPILWLGIFGVALSNTKGIPTNGVPYLEYITPGILAQSVIFVAIFYGLSIIWERDMGSLQKILVTPTPRLALVWAKMFSAGIRGLSQAIIIFLFSIILGIHLHITLITVIGVLLLIILGGGFFTGISMIIASLVKTREKFMGIGQIITLPLFFASNAIYPIEIMPHWLQIVARVNPLSYMVDGLRSLLVSGSISQLYEQLYSLNGLKMKKTNGLIITIIVLILVVTSIFLLFRQANKDFKKANVLESKITAVFECPNDKSIAAVFYPSNHSVNIVLSDGRKLSLPQTISASGARYANSDESFVFWNKGNTAFIEEGNTTTYQDCVDNSIKT